MGGFHLLPGGWITRLQRSSDILEPVSRRIRLDFSCFLPKFADFTPGECCSHRRLTFTHLRGVGILELVQDRPDRGSARSTPIGCVRSPKFIIPVSDLSKCVSDRTLLFLSLRLSKRSGDGSLQGIVQFGRIDFHKLVLKNHHAYARWRSPSARQRRLIWYRSDLKN